MQTVHVQRNSDGRLEVFGVGGDGQVWHNWQEKANSGWVRWDSFGGQIRWVRTNVNKDGRMEVFGVGMDGTVLRIFQEKPHSGPWTAWNVFGGARVNWITSHQNDDHRIEVVAVGVDGKLWHSWQPQASGAFENWAILVDGAFLRCAVSRNKDGRLEVFGLRTDGAVVHVWQDGAGKGPWKGPQQLGTAAGFVELEAHHNDDGRIEVFGLAADGSLHHNWQKSSSRGSDWAGWSSYEPVIRIRNLHVASNKDGRMEIFGLDTSSGVVAHMWQEKANGGWSKWRTLNSPPATDVAVGRNDDGRLEVFIVGPDAKIYHTWQNHAGSDWTPKGWQPL